MLIKTVFAGFGGQGVLMMGYSLAHSAMLSGFETTYLPTYGAEIRGGTAHCTVSVADEEIASPIASRPENLVAMNEPSLTAFQNIVAPGGAIFLNSSIIKQETRRKDVAVFAIPAVEMAERIGNTRAANIVMMGAVIKKMAIIAPETFLKSLEEIMGSKKKSALEMNRLAFRQGYDLL